MSSHKAQAIADIGAGTILARIEIAAPPERVFRAISTEELSNWWGADGLYRTTKHTVDLRPGGRYRSEGVSTDGNGFHVEGEIVDVDPPHRLVQTWQSSWETGPTTTVTWTLDPIPTGTRLTLRHTGFTDGASCENHADGWQRVITWLNGYASPAMPTERYYMARLLPPRPSFMLDMTTDERAVMQAHALYWRDLLAAGKVVAFGAVGGAAGGFGLGLCRADDEAALTAMQAADPAIQSARGFHYENLPMHSLIY